MPIGIVGASLIGSAIAGGTSIAGAKMASGANKDAAKTQAGSDAESLALQERMYQQDRSDLGQSREDLSPFRALGAGAAGLLGHGLGINMAQPPAAQAASAPSSRPMSALMAPVTPNEALTADRMNVDNRAGKLAELQAMRAGPQAAAQQNSQSGYVQILAPNGKVGNIPSAMVEKALAAGGRMVN